MKIELSKEDLEKAIKNYIDVWFTAVEVTNIEFVRTKKVYDLKVQVTTKEKGE